MTTVVKNLLPTPHRPRSNNVIEKKLDQMNKTLNTSERNQVDINNILAHILQSLKRDQPLQQQQQLQQPQPKLKILDLLHQGGSTGHTDWIQLGLVDFSLTMV
jgi:hypothetical protein